MSVVGGTPPPPGGLAAASDPYTLPLVGRGVGSARKLVKMVERHVQARGLPSETVGDEVTRSSGVVVRSGHVPAPPPPDPATAVDPPGASPPDGEDLVVRLRELAELHEAGALTDEEFERAKARVLG